MRIVVDADACPGKDIIEAVAQRFNLPVIMYCDNAHLLNSNYSEIRVVEQGSQEVDNQLFLEARPEDIVITQDIGLAAMVMGKGTFALNPSGIRYNPATIDFQMATRHVAAKQRRRGRYGKGPKKRTAADGKQLASGLEAMIRERGGG